MFATFSHKLYLHKGFYKSKHVIKIVTRRHNKALCWTAEKTLYNLNCNFPLGAHFCDFPLMRPHTCIIVAVLISAIYTTGAKNSHTCSVLNNSGNFPNCAIKSVTRDGHIYASKLHSILIL